MLNVVRRAELVCDAAHTYRTRSNPARRAEIAISLNISQVKRPRAEPAIDDRDFTVATIVAPSAMKAEEEEAAAEGEVPIVGEEGAEGEGEAEGGTEGGAEGGKEA